MVPIYPMSVLVLSSLEMSRRQVRVLGFHALYACRDSGVCCSSGWPIPIEADRIERAQSAMAARLLRPVRGGDRAPFVFAADAPSDTPAVVATCDDVCVFHDPAGRCAIHAALGHDALPLACRQFPRVSVADPRGVSVTLSHYCPTAAAMLERSDGAADAIHINAPGFPADGEYVGLDATSVMPPLLREGVLMDWESWWEFERLSVHALLTAGDSAGSALAIVRGAEKTLAAWSPGDGALTDAVRRAFDSTVIAGSIPAQQLVAEAFESVPAPYQGRARWTSTVATSDRGGRRFLAAHAFANWAVHSETGLRAWIRSVESAHAFITLGAGVRHADLVLRHLAG